MVVLSHDSTTISLVPRLCMGYSKVKDEQFRLIIDVIHGRDTFVSLWEVSLLQHSAMGI